MSHPIAALIGNGATLDEAINVLDGRPLDAWALGLCNVPTEWAPDYTYDATHGRLVRRGTA